jgi:hypothetical protein
MTAKLTAKQQRAIEALLSEPSIRLAAERAVVGEKSIRRWLQRPDFKETYEQARKEAFRDALANLRAASREAVDTLRSALSDDSGPTKISAAKTILTLAVQSVEAFELEMRLQRLEEALLPMDGGKAKT